MNEELLRQVGLTDSEAKVYLTLLGHGFSKTGTIVKHAGISAGKVYLILDKLIQKGFATSITRSGVKYFDATDPERILDYVKQQEEEVKKLENEVRRQLPELKKMREAHEEEQKAEVFEGMKGFRTFMEWFPRTMKAGDTIHILGVARQVNEKLNQYLMQWNRMRVQRGIRLRIIYDSRSRVYGRKRAALPLTQVRYLDIDSPSWIDIFNDYVATIILVDKPTVFLIKNRKVADSYRAYFNILWQQAKA